MTLTLLTPKEISELIAKKARAKRLALNRSQQTLSEHSGVSLSVIKKFEKTGKISLESLLKLALTLDALDEFKELFKPRPVESFASLAELMKADEPRKRGRQ
ncbi:MAG: helix-turn-helix transcriptional regulator [Pseudomonadota bacterium]